MRTVCEPNSNCSKQSARSSRVLISKLGNHYCSSQSLCHEENLLTNLHLQDLFVQCCGRGSTLFYHSKERKKERRKQTSLPFKKREKKKIEEAQFSYSMKTFDRLPGNIYPHFFRKIITLCNFFDNETFHSKCGETRCAEIGRFLFLLLCQSHFTSP